MTNVDYSKIASKYDNDKYRIDIPKDIDLQRLVENSKNRTCRFLDLACGTGNYLATQIGLFAGADIKWAGLDNSPDMLKIAKSKTSVVEYILHDAEQGLPYPEDSFDIVVNNYAFHHFNDKNFIISEIKRVLCPGGVLKMRNGAMEKTPNMWIFQYFPSAQYVDQKRYWPTELLFHELEKEGFNVEINIQHRYYRELLSDIYASARNKDASHFALISDTEYQNGMLRMEKELDGDPQMSISTEFALMECVARLEKDIV